MSRAPPLQDLGSMGEFIAAIATVATLIYLALQIRASNRLARAEEGFSEHVLRFRVRGQVRSRFVD